MYAVLQALPKFPAKSVLQAHILNNAKFFLDIYLEVKWSVRTESHGFSVLHFRSLNKPKTSGTVFYILFIGLLIGGFYDRKRENAQRRNV